MDGFLEAEENGTRRRHKLIINAQDGTQEESEPLHLPERY